VSTPTVCTAPINWNNEDVPDLHPPTPYPRLLDEMVAAGYAATEWSSSFPRYSNALAADLDARGLRLVGTFLPVNFRRREYIELEVSRAVEHARFLKRLGAAHLVVAEAGDARRQAAAGHATPDLFLDEERFDGLVDGLHALGRALRDEGVRPVLHPHVGTYLETPEEVSRLADALEPGLLGWCLDTGHYAYAGGDPRALLARLGPAVEYVHLKDVDGRVLERARAGGWSFSRALAEFIFCPLGEGVSDVRGFLEDLNAVGFSGPLVIEQDTAPDPPAAARANREFVRREAGW
jgi:inosose dehydratase